MISVYFFIKSVVKWSENSVRLNFLWELPSRWAKFNEILSHSVRYGMYGCNTTNYGGMVIHIGATISERSLGNEHCKFLYNGFKTFLLSKVTPFEAKFMKTFDGICYIWACSLIKHYNI